MKKKTLLAYFSFLFILSISSQIKQTSPPKWIETNTYNNEPEIDKNQVTQGVLFLFLDSQINAIKEENYFRKVIKITDNVGIQNSSEINVVFDPTYQKVEFHKITIIRNGKKLNKLKISDFQLIRKESNSENFIYDGSLSATYHIPDVRSDDIIDYDYTVYGYNPIHNKVFSTTFYLNDYFPIGKIKTKIISKNKLSFKSTNTNIQPSINTKNGQFSYTWVNKNTDAVIFEDYTPSWKLLYANVFITEYNSWKEVVNWGVNVFTIKNSVSNSLRLKINEIRKNNKTEGEKINATLNFVQDEIRYLGLESGIGSYKPFSPKKVFNQRFGDCKDKSLLMVTMLKEMGIESYPMLVNTYLKQSIHKVTPSPKFFNHCVVKVVDKNGKPYWYDPTISNQGGAYDATYFPDYRYGLVLKKNNESFDHINSFSSNKVDVTDTFILNEIGKGAELKITSIYYENEADIMRSFFKSNSINSIKKEYEKYYSNYYPNIELAYPPSFTDNIKENKFTVSEQYIIDEIWVTDALNGKTSINFQPTSILEVFTIPNENNRDTEFALYYPSTRHQKTNIHLPNDWLISNEKTTIDSPGFKYDYNLDYNSSERLITIDHTLELKKDHVTPNEYKTYLSTAKKVESNLTYNIFTFNNNTNSPKSIFNVIGQILFIFSLLFASWLAFKLYKYNPQSKIESYYQENKAVGGWLILIGIGLCFTPFRIVHDLFSNEALFINGSWTVFFNPNSPGYNFPLGLIVFIEMVVNAFLLVFVILSIILFFTKRNIFAKTYSILLISSLIFIIIDSFIVLHLTSREITSAETNELLTIFIRTSLVTAYLLISERSKETFIKRLKN
jgi:hypothetical protein